MVDGIVVSERAAVAHAITAALGPFHHLALKALNQIKPLIVVAIIGF
jgi:hypothetical protein